jgi:hypothetical protein
MAMRIRYTPLFCVIAVHRVDSGYAAQDYNLTGGKGTLSDRRDRRSLANPWSPGLLLVVGAGVSDRSRPKTCPLHGVVAPRPHL